MGLALAVFVFVTINAMAFMQAWSMAHYVRTTGRTRQVERLTWWEKFRAVAAGPVVVRMQNVYTPAKYGLAYETKQFQGFDGIQLSAWRIAGSPSAPAVLMFHGYGASKDTLLRAASEFHALGCETWLIDFHGSGDSGGSTTGIGYSEAEDVRAAVAAASAREYGKRPMVLYGTSMGSAAILCANDRGFVHPDAVVLECPFDRFVATIGNRYDLLGVPPFPMAELVAFWCGRQGGFDALRHDPVRYARSVQCPALLFQGERDRLVGLPNGKAIAAALGDHGTYKVFPGLGHAFLCYDGQPAWRDSIRDFLTRNGLLPAPQARLE